jgi:CIC family chloride channel protein
VGVPSYFIASLGNKYHLLRRYAAVFRTDLNATYSRDIQKWLLVAPVIGIVVGLLITLLTTILLDTIWVAILPLYLRHHWMIIPGTRDTALRLTRRSSA